MAKFRLDESDYKRAISIDELDRACNECRHGIIWKDSVAKWYNNAPLYISQLKTALDNGTYKLQNYSKFMIYGPKPRIIYATRFRDRVVQRSLCNNGLYDAFTNSFIYANAACQKGKGITFVFNLAERYLRDYYAEHHTNKGYFIKLDVKQYFASTPHDRLKEDVCRTIREPHFCKHLCDIIDSFPDPRPKAEVSKDPFGARGIGLGSQCSQLLELLYLSPLDHYAKEQLKLKHFVRYMDDMIAIVPTYQEAVEAYQAIEEFANVRGLALNPKSQIGKIDDTLTFLKVNYHLTPTGCVKKWAVKSTVQREMRRITKLVKLYYAGKLSEEDLVQHGNTWYGFAQWRATGHQVKLVQNHILDMLVRNNVTSMDNCDTIVL